MYSVYKGVKIKKFSPIKTMLRIIAAILVIILIVPTTNTVSPVMAEETQNNQQNTNQENQPNTQQNQQQSQQNITEAPPVDISDAKSVILMEQSTRRVLCESNADEKRSPASITKIMTMLLVMEAIDSGRISMDDVVTVSEHAFSFGGSTIFLKEGEQMTVHDLLKGTAVMSANDAAVALAEYVGGSEQAFVDMMNMKAAELGMTNTCFKNSHGLDEDGHYTTARDIAIMSAELMEHEKIFEFTGIWMDSLRNGQTELVNTNKLIRFYEPATGLKTGTTNKAGSCISATAEKNGLHLIAVVLGAPNSDKRNAVAKALLEYGFANWQFASPTLPPEIFNPVKVVGGVESEVEVTAKTKPQVLVKKGEELKLECFTEIAEDVQAPVELGEVVGTVTVKLGEDTVAEIPLITTKSIDKMTYSIMLGRVLSEFFCVNTQ